ncbi:MAG TPA: CAP domain-containing protein [Burkholderiales bacterium]|jgi:uncharacterized protein YkwD|nr:CAP domain-containing protein [Burkholderiales bacterium]
MLPPVWTSHYSEPRRGSVPLLLALLLVCTAAFAQDKAPAGQPAFTQEVEQRVTALTNDLRKQNGLQPVQPEARLTETARAFAGYLANTGKLEHDADGTTPADRVKKRGYTYCLVAENLASEYNTAGFTVDTLSRNVVQGWRESPTHLGNMLQPDVTQIGVGVARSGKDGEYFAVQVFARPMSQAVKFQVTNRANAAVRYDYRKRSVTLAAKQTRTHESCVSGEIRIESPGLDLPTHPKNGGRYAIVESGKGTYRLKEE